MPEQRPEVGYVGLDLSGKVRTAPCMGVRHKSTSGVCVCITYGWGRYVSERAGTGARGRALSFAGGWRRTNKFSSEEKWPGKGEA